MQNTIGYMYHIMFIRVVCDIRYAENRELLYFLTPYAIGK